MRVKTKTVYYCDFCKKHYLLRPSMESHEKHCTKNPNRICRMCERTDINTIIPKYRIEVPEEWWKKDTIGSGRFLPGEKYDRIRKETKERIEQLRDEVEGCPNCMFTVIRCNGYELPVDAQFDYQEELKKWWEIKNEEAREKEEEDLRNEIQQL